MTILTDQLAINFKWKRSKRTSTPTRGRRSSPTLSGTTSTISSTSPLSALSSKSQCSRSVSIKILRIYSKPASSQNQSHWLTDLKMALKSRPPSCGSQNKLSKFAVGWKKVNNFAGLLICHLI